MLIVSIIALFTTLITIVVRLSFNKWLQNLYEYVNSLDLNEPTDFKTAVKMVYGDPVEIYENALVICAEQWAEKETIIYDFSRWDTKKIIGIMSMHPNVIYDDDEKPRINIVPKQKVFRYKDGTILWSPQLQ
jgi:hypothetical protein